MPLYRPGGHRAVIKDRQPIIDYFSNYPMVDLYKRSVSRPRFHSQQTPVLTLH